MKLDAVELVHEIRPFGARKTFDPGVNATDRGITLDYNPGQRLVRVARPGKKTVCIPTEAVAWMIISEEADAPAKDAKQR